MIPFKNSTKKVSVSKTKHSHCYVSYTIAMAVCNYFTFTDLILEYPAYTFEPDAVLLYARTLK